MDFEELIAEAAAAPVDGWDFSWLDGRATEQRPSWGYQRLLAERLPHARRALDIGTGGGEVLAGVPEHAPRTTATESWPPNLAVAAALLGPRGVAVVGGRDDALPFADGMFDFACSRHPVRACWPEVARVLAPGGTYLSQEVGPRSVAEVTEFFLGPQASSREPEAAQAAAEAAGLDVVDLRLERLRTEFYDVGAVVYFLRKVIWIVPDFSVERYRHRLRAMHDHIQSKGTFVATTTRFLIETHRPRPW